MNQYAGSDSARTNDASTTPDTKVTASEECDAHWTPYENETVLRNRERMARMYWQTFGR